MSLTLTAPSGIPGDLPHVSSINKYRGCAWWTVYFPLSRGIEIGSFVGKLESEESSVIGDSSKVLQKTPVGGTQRPVAPQGAPGRIHVCEGRVRLLFRFGRNT